MQITSEIRNAVAAAIKPEMDAVESHPEFDPTAEAQGRLFNVIAGVAKAFAQIDPEFDEGEFIDLCGFPK